MKKVLTMCLAALLILQSSVAMASGLGGAPVVMDDAITFEAKTADAAYTEALSLIAGQKMDMKAALDMSPAKEKFDAMMKEVEALVGTAGMEVVKKRDLKADLTLTMSFGSAITLPESVTKENKMAGFDAATKKLYVESTRTHKIAADANGKSVTTLEIKLGFKEGTTVGAVAADTEAYFNDIEYIASDVLVSADGSYTLNGVMNCDIYVEELPEDRAEFDGAAVITVTAAKPTYDIRGKVEGGTAPIQVVLKKGNDVAVADVALAEDGSFVIEDQISGLYNIVVTDAAGSQKSVAVNIVGGDVEVGSIILPEYKVVENVTVKEEVKNVEDAATEKQVEINANIADVVEGATNVANEVAGDAVVSVEVDTTISKVEDSAADDLLESIKKKLEETMTKLPNIVKDALVKVETVITATTEGDVAIEDIQNKVLEELKNQGKGVHVSFAIPTEGKENLNAYVVVGDEVTVLEEGTKEEAKVGTYYVDDNGVLHAFVEPNVDAVTYGYADITVDEVVTPEGPEDPEDPEDPVDPKPEKPGTSVRPVGGSSSGSNLPVSGNKTDKPVVSVTNFNDVTVTDWFYNSVDYVVNHGIMNGTSANTFDPELTTTRGMVATVLWRMAGEPAPVNTISFADVEAGEYYDKAIAWGAEKKILLGYGDGNYGPNDLVTREQLSAIMWRYAGVRGANVSVGENTDITIYSDYETIEEYAVPAVKWATATKLVQGNDDGTINPAGNATRAELAAILTRYMQNIGK